MADWRAGSWTEKLNHVLTNKIYTDCCFIVGVGHETKEFRAHKLVLSMASEVFAAMFHGGFSEEKEVHITDIKPSTFESLLEYMYGVNLKMSSMEMAVDVLLAANKYLINSLIPICVNYISSHVVSGNVLDVLEVADKIGDLKLKEDCTRVLQTATEEVLNSEGWLDVSLSTVLMVLQLEALNVDSELELLFACQRWARKQLEDQGTEITNCKVREILTPMLPYIRLKTVEAKYLVEASKQLDFCLTKDEILAIYEYYLHPDMEMPNSFCESVIMREVNDLNICNPNSNDVPNFTVTFYYNLINLKRNSCSSSPQTMHFQMNVCRSLTGFCFQALNLGVANTKYSETFSVGFYHGKSCLAKHHFSGELTSSLNYIVMFSEPCKLLPGTIYHIKMVFHNKNQYPKLCHNKAKYDAPELTVVDYLDNNLCQINKLYFN